MAINKWDGIPLQSPMAAVARALEALGCSNAIVLPTEGDGPMPSAQSAITRYHINPAFTKARDIYADGAEIARGQRVLHLSGQVGIRPDGTTSPNFAAQCDHALINLHAVLKAAAMSPEHVVKLTCYVVGQQPLAALYDARRRHLPNVAPAATTVIVQGLAAPEWLIEIEAIAAA